jgi:hypothetical protein
MGTEFGSRSHPIPAIHHLKRVFTVLGSLALLFALPAGTIRASTVHRVAIANIQVSHDSFPAHSEPALAENPTNHKNLIAGTKFFTDPAHYKFKIGMFYSKDGGLTWHDTGLLPGFGEYPITSDVSIAFGPDGTAYTCVLAYDGKASGIFVVRSTDGGATWQAPVPVFLDTAGATFSDKPWIAVDQTAGSTSGNVHVAWNLDPGGGSSHGDPDAGDAATIVSNRVFQNDQTNDQSKAPIGIVVSSSTDGGKTFSAPQAVYAFDNTHFALGAVPGVGPDGRLYVVFASVNEKGLVDSIDEVDSRDGGVTFSAPHLISPVTGLPNHLSGSTFRNFTLPTLAVSPKDGALVVAWADMRYGDADILATRSTDGGKHWSAPARVNHDHLSNGKDQFQPALAVAPDGIFTCAWFDRRHDPANRLIDEEVAQSTNDGLIFGKNLRVTQQSWNPAIDAPLPEGKKTNTFIGDYQALVVDNQTVHPLWNDTQNGVSQQIRTAIVSIRLFARR